MAINKKKNVTVQVTFPKEDAKNLENLVQAYNENGIRCTKSDILLKSFQEYLRAIIIIPKINKAKEKVEEPQGEEQDA